MKAKKKPVDNSAHYRHTEYPARDAVFNWLVRRYGVKGNKWEKSDDQVFGGFIYHVWDFFVAVLFIYLMWIIFGWIQKSRGDIHAIAFLLIMILFRLNALIRKVSKLVM